MISGLNWATVGLFGRNFIASIGNRTIQNIIYALFGLSSLYLLSQRDAFLPFLSFGVLPCRVIQTTQPEEWDTKVDLPAPPGSMVIYWAAERGHPSVLKSAEDAYSGYFNSGATVAGPTGYALARIRFPQRYIANKLGMSQKIEPHIHYRYCHKKTGKLSDVKSIQLDESLKNLF